MTLKRGDKYITREAIDALLGTPPIIGAFIERSPVETLIEDIAGRQEIKFRHAISVHCDPDVLEQTARKNAELQETLAEIKTMMDDGRLAEVVRCEDCIHYETYYHCCKRHGHFIGMPCDGYCSLGERRDHEDIR